MPVQRNFAEIAQVDLDGQADKIVVQWTTTGVDNHVSTTTSGFFSLETSGMNRFLVPKAGYVSRVFAIIESSTPHTSGAIDLSLGVVTRTSPSTVSTVANTLPSIVANAHNYNEVLLSTDIPFVVNDALQIEWSVFSSVVIGTALNINIWAELTLPVV